MKKALNLIIINLFLIGFPSFAGDINPVSDIEANIQRAVANTEKSILLAQRSSQNTRRATNRNYKRFESKAELSRAIALAKERKYAEASMALYDLSLQPKYRAERQQIRYILGLMLFQMNMHQMAGYQFVSVVRDGKSSYVDKAMEKLTVSADILNDRTLLNYSMSKIRLEKFPVNMRSMLRFRIGEFQFQNEEFAKAAHNFSRVPATSPYYSRAKYLEGLAAAQSNKLSDAMRAFTQLERARVGDGPVDNNYVAAKISKARIYYQNRSWDKAVEEYRDIPKDSHFWHEALFEMSWALMRSAKLRSVLSNFHSLHSPFYSDAYIPESILLRGIVYLYICQYDEMEKTLDLFQSIYNPVSNKLKTYLAKRLQPSQYYIDYLKIQENIADLEKNPDSRDAYDIPYILFNYLSNQGDIEATQFYINKLIEESQQIQRMPDAWKVSGIGKASIKLLDRRVQSARRKMGLSIKRHLILKNRELDRLIEQHDFARFEMLNAKKEGIKKRLGEEKEDKVDASFDREFYIQNGFEYYPFKGEYWLDELGNYHYLGTQSCE